ncbi:MAG: acyl carrier protein [Egibacteraceae bacterium]
MIEEFIRRTVQIPYDDAEFSRAAPLFDAGYVDSLGVVSLMEFIETSFGIELVEEDLFDEQFTTIDGMSKIIAVRLSDGGCRT